MLPSSLEHPARESAWFLHGLAFVQMEHGAQADKSGKPYWTHLQRVALRLLRRFPDTGPEEVLAALLHDWIEDVLKADTAPAIDAGVLALVERGYSPMTAEIVRLVTKDKTDGLTYQQRIALLASAMRASEVVERLERVHGIPAGRAREFARGILLGAIRVKLADNEDNSDPERIAALPVNEQGIQNRYRSARSTLEEGLDRFEANVTLAMQNVSPRPNF